MFKQLKGVIFMDYAVFSELCSAKNTTPTALTLKLGLSKGNANSWKKGGNPSADVLIKLADELNCTVDLLLGRKEKNSSTDNLSENELEMLEIFQKFNDREQIKLIGKLEELYRQKQIKENQQPAAFKVARSADGKFRKTELSPEELERIHNLPDDTDF